MRRGATPSRASTVRASASFPSRSTRGGRSCSSIPIPAAAPLAEHLGDLPRLVADGGVDVDALVFHQRAETEYDANWKVCVENYLECYHCAVAHPSFSKAIDVAPGTYTLEEHPTFSSQYGPPKNGGGGVYDADGEVDRGQFHLLFPGTAINVMPGRGNFSIGPIMPLGAERTYRFLDYFFLPDTDEQWIADYLELDNQVGAEDRVLVERVQVGMRSGLIDVGLPAARVGAPDRALRAPAGRRARRRRPRSRGSSRRHTWRAAERRIVFERCRPAPSPPIRASSTASSRGSSSTRACSTWPPRRRSRCSSG